MRPGVLASGFLAVSTWFIVDQRLRPYIKFTTFIGWGDVFAVIPVMVLTGVLISLVASYLSLLRYLRV